MDIDSKNTTFLQRITATSIQVYRIAAGLSAAYVLDIVFNYVLYPSVIYKLGIVKGGLVMLLLSFIACIGTMKFYDWSMRDWFGIEAIKMLRDYRGNKRIGRVISGLLRRSQFIAFMYLSIQRDPFVTTAYMRKGNFCGMSSRDWTIFVCSLLIGNMYWIFVCYMGITVFEWGWDMIKTIY